MSGRAVVPTCLPPQTLNYGSELLPHLLPLHWDVLLQDPRPEALLLLPTDFGHGVQFELESHALFRCVP